MKFSKATNYALHTMVYLADKPKGTSIGVERLAETQKLSPTYLSKILTKLVKAGLIESTPGAKGGYRLARKGDNITFLDVIHAIEGQTVLFYCSIYHDDDFSRNEECLIENAMIEAEEKMKESLDRKYIMDIAKLMRSQKNLQ